MLPWLHASGNRFCLFVSHDIRLHGGFARPPLTARGQSSHRAQICQETLNMWVHGFLFNSGKIVLNRFLLFCLLRGKDTTSNRIRSWTPPLPLYMHAAWISRWGIYDSSAFLALFYWSISHLVCFYKPKDVFLSIWTCSRPLASVMGCFCDGNCMSFPSTVSSYAALESAYHTSGHFHDGFFEYSDPVCLSAAFSERVAISSPKHRTGKYTISISFLQKLDLAPICYAASL